jgi:tetratricopeptide (TPR) repeat protein
LYSLRALEDEQQLDFKGAESDWKKYVEIASDRGAARIALADYYHRRLESQKEFDTLNIAARELTPPSETRLPESQQRPWKTYERILKLVEDQRLNPNLGAMQYNAWILRYPAASTLYQRAFAYALAHQIWDAAEQSITAYQRAFPAEIEFPIEARAELTAKLGPAAQALAVYERSFRPLWPPKLVVQYFALLKQTNSLRTYLEHARAGVAANPTDIGDAARIFYYWQQQGNVPAAERALTEFRQRKDAQNSPWTAEELLTLARLSESVHNYDEAARNYYALYSVAKSDDATAETALASLAKLLLNAPEQAIHFGSGDLSLYRDVATMDLHPGFLNGVLSLLLNGADPRNRYAIEEQSAGAYFRRSRATELVALFESRFPNSSERAELRERVIEAYAIYGSNDGVIRAGTRFLADFPNATNRTAVALRMADAYARTNQARLEFATYDALLQELAKRADGVPLGAIAQTAPPAGQQTPAGTQYDLLRSPDYARVLDRYVARLVSMKRLNDALVIYRREIDRNPNDPGLYDVLAAFLQQNRLGAQVEQVYQKAIAQFPDHSWEHKLARWYLRQRRQADLSKLTRDVIRIFSGTELDAYFQEIVHLAAPVGPALYLQLNLYAHQRFPHHLSFVHNLLTAYSTGATRNEAAFEAQLREHWYDDENLRRQFFERLSRTGRLNADLAALRASSEPNPAGVRMLAEGEAWRGHFEAAAPLMLAMETDYPADGVIGRRTAAVYRSLGAVDSQTSDPKMTDEAVAVETKLHDADPRDRQTLTRLGEIEAERERFDRAAEAWNRIPDVEPANADAYLEAATVFWDYYRYDDALRWIDEARTKLAQPSLFAYESGAILENKRAYDRAVREYARGAIAQPGSNAERRLLALARRPALRAQVEQLTDNLVSARNPQMGAFQLRVALLKNQNRRDDLEAFLLAVAARANVPALLTAIGEQGRIDGFQKAQQAAIEREIAQETDPVERMRLRLSLARFFEGQGQIAQGGQVIDALYRENPAILGVVRAAVDFHWRNKQSKIAIDVLEQSAARGETDYGLQFTLEAARKATEAGDYARARGFAGKLLAADPNRAEYVAAMADTFARAGDDRGLRAFYEQKIQAAQGGDDLAAMRRALIPVLTRIGNFSTAVNQYVALLNLYPEDEGLTREAALYAAVNGVAPKLLEYYAKASADSPKDARWPMLLAKIETQLEDFPAALTSYTRASAIRPDRADLLIARLNLEERLQHFEEEASTAEKLYELTYRNPQWMQKLAEIRARQGRNADAVAALNKAWIEGRSENGQNTLAVAEKLEEWGMLAEARKFAQDAARLAPESGLVALTRILIRQREYQAALANVATAEASLMDRAIPSAGRVVARYYSPEEKLKFGAALATQSRRIDWAENSGLFDLEVKWRYERLMANPVAQTAEKDEQRILQLQHDRLQFAELGGQLEAYDRALPAGASHASELLDAAAAYRAAGNTVAELRVLEAQNARSALNGPMFDRYCQLLIAQPPRMISTLARERRPEATNAMMNYVIQHASASVAQQAITARGQKLGPLWTKAYTSLAGLYYANGSASVRAAFHGMLGEMTIGSRIGKATDRDQQLAGDLWFYYGGRYGEYLNATHQQGAEKFLPATVEANPGRSQAYFTLAEYFRESGDADGAQADYRHALELVPSRADVHDRLAMIAAKAGHDQEAAEEWKLAIAALREAMNRATVSPSFWIDLGDTLRHLGEAKVLGPLRDDVDKLLRLYIRRNGGYQTDGLLEAAYAASGDAAWIADLSRAAADPVQILSAIVNVSWIPDPQKDVLYRSIIESAQARVAQSFGDEQIAAEAILWNWQIERARFLLGRNENAEATGILASIPVEIRKQRAAEIIPIEIRVAARTGTLAAQLARYDEPLSLEPLRNAATELAKAGESAEARRVLAFVYDHELKAGNFDASNFMGLADIRLEENDAAGAMALLRRMSMISGAAFSELDAAAALLEKHGRVREATEFLTALVHVEPWNFGARERLAAAQGSMEALSAIAKSAQAPYAGRVAAALAIRKGKALPLTDTDQELRLLSSPGEIASADASKPYFAAARTEAAAATRDAATREMLLAGAIAIDPAISKVTLLRTAIAARHDALAVAVARQILPPYFSDESAFTTWIADSFLGAYTDTDRAEIARMLGEAHQRMGEFRSAELFYRIADSIAPEDRLGRAIASLRARIEAGEKNEALRPVVTDNLDQDRLVRSREMMP